MTRSVYTLVLFFISWILILQPSFAQQIKIENAFSERFLRPLGIEHSHEGSSLLYIVERRGKVLVKDTQNPEASSTTFIDISDRVIASSGELGLLGLAFSPDFQNNNTFYIYYTFEEGGNYYSTLSRYKTSGGVGNPKSEERLFELLQPQDNHNGGQVVFGPDGYLYISLGDGGRGNAGLAQDTGVLNGSILRIDVTPETGYDIPPDNPFIGDPSGRDEIYAWGFRNPWRMSFDKATGDLWVADVGQKDRETIYIVEKGKNYGWPIVEGTLCYPIGSKCDKTGLEMPLYEYPYGQENTGGSITGGYVYRGGQNPTLYGKYIYGDFMTGRIWALEIDQETMSPLSNTLLLETGMRIPSFGLDSSGEIYLLEWESIAKIYRFAPELTLTTATLKSVDGSGALQLSWDVNRDSGIDSFEIYKGKSLNDLTLFTTVSGSVQEYLDSDLLLGSTFYKVRAIESNGSAGEMSDPVSYYKSTDTVVESWQMMSIPYNTNGVVVENTVAYSFDGTYSKASILESGKGYWVRSTVSGGSEYEAEGLGVQTDTLQLIDGWNLIGGLTGELPNEFIEDYGGILNTVPMYGFNGASYEEATSLIPGEGYWLYAEQSGEITLDLDAYSATLPLNSVLNNSVEQAATNQKLDRLTFETANGNAEFFVSDNTLSENEKNRFLLPPISPNAELDVRTIGGFKLAEGFKFEPEIVTRDYPVTIQFASAGNEDLAFINGSDKAYEVRVGYKSNGNTETIVIREGDYFKINELFSKLEFFRTEISDELVRKTELLPSYPNPFNPTTNITYSISNQRDVSLAIFDVTGRLISTLVDSKQDAGQYELPFDASGLASGIYFVRFSAGDVFLTQKLTLIK